MEKVKIPHDQVYKILYSNPGVVESLIDELLPKQLSDKLDSSTLRLYSGEYVTEGFRKFHSDVVWQLQWKDGGTVCRAVLLLEFQRNQDPLMALRILTYSALLLAKIYETEKATAKGNLPLVLPVVLYNGSGKWKSPVCMKELFGLVPEDATPHQPLQTYLLLDENHMPEEDLERCTGIAAQFVRLERAKDILALRRVVAGLDAQLQGPGFENLQRLVAQWVSDIVRNRFDPEATGEVKTLREVTSMLEENVDRWWKQAKDEGIQEGIRVGIQEGIREGIQEGIQEGRIDEKKATVRRVAECLFGSIPQSVTNRIMRTSNAQALDTLLISLVKRATPQEFEHSVRQLLAE